MLKLPEGSHVAEGKHYLVFPHPQNKDFLVKVLNPTFLHKSTYRTLLIKKFPLLSRYRLSKGYIREVIEMVRLRFTENFTPPVFVQKFVGFEDTSLGLGVVVKAEKARDGNYATSLRLLIKNHQFDLKAQQKLEEFCEKLAQCDLAVTDLHLGNLVYAYNEEHKEHFVIIDGFGDKTLLPVLRTSKFLRKIKRIQKINELKKLVEKRMEKAALAYREPVVS